MKKKILNKLFILILTATLFVVTYPVNTFAIVADYPEIVAQQKLNADAEIIGTVISSEFANTGKSTVDQYRVNYSVQITEVIKGDTLSEGEYVNMISLCQLQGDLINQNVSHSDCIKWSPKIGDIEHIYLNFKDSKFEQAIMYEDQVSSITALNDCDGVLESSCVQAAPFYMQSSFYENTVIPSAIILSIITAVLITIVIIKKNKSKAKKSNKS